MVEPVEATPSSGRRASATWEALFRAQGVILRRLAEDPIWGDVSLREYDVLFVLTQAGGALRLRDLTGRLFLVQSSVSRLTERMAARGLVTRTTPPDDARGTLVALTDEGRRLQREAGARHQEAIARYVGQALDDDEQRTLRGLLDRLSAAQADIPRLDRGFDRG
ncbi:transcriptional regulator, MarR family [Xylanimonas cellulosilytica DSM 15894]|uniref:Transcriptional regulator, MarR family n=1 Tax=Xylanimonas cellulosilytica (strain DSM 15894 / JCM 12276 / CECT 5975 / KCTC 9989 / LMG 20990 / NBRC 107835 / XIL07) TaxID=446471 RepID=D1BX74_XYLCX|nr:MarR family winged helix-turn-helix transcriptional regulator [Xylanimonas cellulosilytica]ACZ31642.1 transcriptional regulator, MarR family [Xylanimonas cellulosilytica DSM 15894]